MKFKVIIGALLALAAAIPAQAQTKFPFRLN